MRTGIVRASIGFDFYDSGAMAPSNQVPTEQLGRGVQHIRTQDFEEAVDLCQSKFAVPIRTAQFQRAYLPYGGF